MLDAAAEGHDGDEHAECDWMDGSRSDAKASIELFPVGRDEADNGEGLRQRQQYRNRRAHDEQIVKCEVSRLGHHIRRG